MAVFQLLLYEMKMMKRNEVIANKCDDFSSALLKKLVREVKNILNKKFGVKYIYKT